jgi:hypothetical protein
MKRSEAFKLIRLVCLFGATSLVALGPFPLWANPTGEVIQEGAITVTPGMNRLDINQTSRTPSIPGLPVGRVRKG